MIIVYSYYCIDILHKGHLEMLQNAKGIAGQEGKLIVGVLTDKAIMEKKPKPVLCFEERVDIARSIKYIDLVIVQETYTPLPNIRVLKPDVLMESTSHTEDQSEIEQAMKDIGGRIIRIPYFPNHSSALIKGKLSNG